MHNSTLASGNTHRIQNERHTLHRRVIAMEYRMGRLMRRAHDTKVLRRTVAYTAPQPSPDTTVIQEDLDYAQVRNARLLGALDENTRTLDLLDTDDRAVQTLQDALHNAKAEIAATQAALRRCDLTPHERVAIAVAIHDTGAYQRGGGEDIPPQPIPLAQTADQIGLTPRTFGAALIHGAKVGLINRTEELCSKDERGDVQYQMIVRLGPPIAFQAPRLQRRPARKPVVAGQSVENTEVPAPHAPGRAQLPPHNPSFAPPTCPTCSAYMVAMEYACPLCEAGSDSPPESYVVKQHMGSSINICAGEQHMALEGPSVGASGNDCVPPDDHIVCRCRVCTSADASKRWPPAVLVSDPVQTALIYTEPNVMRVPISRAPAPDLAEAAAIVRVATECGMALRLSENAPYKILVSPTEVIAQYPDVCDMIRNWREQIITYLYDRDESSLYTWTAPRTD